jgi:hypothetical protein
MFNPSAAMATVPNGMGDERGERAGGGAGFMDGPRSDLARASD